MRGSVLAIITPRAKPNPAEKAFPTPVFFIVAPTVCGQVGNTLRAL